MKVNLLNLRIGRTIRFCDGDLLGFAMRCLVGAIEESGFETLVSRDYRGHSLLSVSFGVHDQR